jgi:hypothetical protein
MPFLLSVTLSKLEFFFLNSFHPGCEDCSNSAPGEFTWVEGTRAGGTLQSQLGVVVHKDSFAMLLQPGETVHAKLGFRPIRTGPISALIFVRNNLTILEVVQVSGQAAHAQFKFGNRKPGSGTPLLFELAEKHLKDCESKLIFFFLLHVPCLRTVHLNYIFLNECHIFLCHYLGCGGRRNSTVWIQIQGS